MNGLVDLHGWRPATPLGCGQSGVVRLAQRGSEVAAIKRCRPDGALDVALFRREIENARIAHEIIPDGSPAVIDCDAAAACPWFAMTLVEPLFGTYSRTTAVRHLLRLLDLAIRLRKAGFLHCDIKKENLCLIGGRLGLLDFASLTPVAFANTHALRLGSDFLRAPEVDCDRVVSEASEVHAIAATFLQFARPSAVLRYALPLLRALLPFPWLRYRTLDEFRRAVEREPLRRARVIRLSAGVWKTRIVARCITGRIAALVLAAGLVAAGSYGVRLWRMCRYEERELQAQAERTAAIGCADLGDRTNAHR